MATNKKYVMDKDLGMKKIILNLQSAHNAVLKVGVLTGTKNAEGYNVAEYGAANEYGTEKIPSRPFMATSFDENKPTYIKYMTKIVKASGEQAFSQMVNQLGLMAQKDIKETITGRDFLPKLAPQTIAAKKGSTKTLVDTSALVNGINYTIKK